MKIKIYKSLGQFLEYNKFNFEYFKEYIEYIKSRKRSRDILVNGQYKKLRKLGMEIHHILPTCLKGINLPRNKVGLYGDEHMVAHNLLDRALWRQWYLNDMSGKHNKIALKMLRAISGSRRKLDKNKYTDKVILREYFKRTSSVLCLEMKNI